MGRAATLVALLSASCVSSTSNVCEDGSLCPGGFVCDIGSPEGPRCLLPEQVALCEGVEPNGACSFDGAPGACRSGACIVFFCGDGYVTEGEECEGEDLQSKTCNDFGFYLPATGLACTSACTFDLGVEAEHTGCYANNYCGDDKLNGNELCDGPEDRTCVSIGFDAGTTSCNLQCGFSIGDCSRFGWNPESLSEVIALAVAGTAHDNQWAFGLDGRAMQFEGAYWITRPAAPAFTNDLINGWTFGTNNTWAIGASRPSPALPPRVLRWGGINTGWSEVTGVPAGEYIDVWGPSETEVYVAADTGIHKFDGTTWTTLAGFSGTPKQIRGSSGSNIYVSTTEGPLEHFNGSGWTPITAAPLANMTVQFLDVNATNDVWAIGFQTCNLCQPDGMIAHWNGTTWDTWQTPQETYNTIAATAPHDAWVGGADGIMRHWDGTAWSRSANIGSSPSGLTALSGMIALGPDEIVAVSTLNLAYRYRGQAYGTVKPISNDPYYDPFTSPLNTAIWSSSPNNQYVTNAKGEVWRFNGTAWSLKFTVPGGERINDIWGLDPAPDDPAVENVWIVSENGSAYHNDGTSTWTPYVVNGVGLQRVWLNATDVWVFGENGAYHKEGTTWAHTPLTVAGRVESVSGSSSSNIWAVQITDDPPPPAPKVPNPVWHYNGIDWVQIQTGSSEQELAVAAIADDDVHITAESGHFVRWNGSSWIESAIPVLDHLRYVSYAAFDDIVAASSRDLAHFNGTSWSTVRTPVDFVPNTADYLPIVDIHISPGRIDMLQQRFRIRTLIRTRPLICRPADPGETNLCDDGVDNDCDGLIDTIDPQCM